MYYITCNQKVILWFNIYSGDGLHVKCLFYAELINCTNWQSEGEYIADYQEEGLKN